MKKKEQKNTGKANKRVHKGSQESEGGLDRYSEQGN